MCARELLAALSDAGLSVAAEGDRLVIRPGSKLTDSLQAALREAKQEVLALLHRMPGGCDPHKAAIGCATVNLSRQRYEERLLRLRWPRFDAAAFAGRLVERDRSGDDRVSCFECRYYLQGACENYRRAGMPTRALSAELVMLLQRCSGFSPFRKDFPAANGALESATTAAADSTCQF